MMTAGQLMSSIARSLERVKTTVNRKFGRNCLPSVGYHMPMHMSDELTLERDFTLSSVDGEEESPIRQW